MSPSVSGRGRGRGRPFINSLSIFSAFPVLNDRSGERFSGSALGDLGLVINSPLQLMGIPIKLLGALGDGFRSKKTSISDVGNGHLLEGVCWCVMGHARE